MDIIASRRHFNVTNSDVVMYDGSCYHLMTQRYKTYEGRYHLPCDNIPEISDSQAKKYIKDGVLKEYMTKVIRGVELTYYQFRVNA